MIDCRMGKLPANTELERLKQLSVIHRDWVPEELSFQAAQANAGSKNGQKNSWPGAGGALPCLGGSLQMLRENGQLLCLAVGEGLLINSTESHLKLNCLGRSGSVCLGSGCYYQRAIFSRLTQDMKLNPDWVNISVSLFLWESGPEFKRLFNTLKPPTVLSLPPTQAPRNWLIPTVFSAARRSCSQLGKFPRSAKQIKCTLWLELAELERFATPTHSRQYLKTSGLPFKVE